MFAPLDLLRVWPDDVLPFHRFEIPHNYQTEQPHPTIYMGLVPATTSWQLPAFLHFGDWNYCPPPEEHAAVLKRWQEKYQAEVVGITHDIIELRVGDPPRSREQALVLACEQYSYAHDIVAQGVDRIAVLAAMLLNGSTWGFWWD